MKKVKITIEAVIDDDYKEFSTQLDKFLSKNPFIKIFKKPKISFQQNLNTTKKFGNFKITAGNVYSIKDSNKYLVVIKVGTACLFSSIISESGYNKLIKMNGKSIDKMSHIELSLLRSINQKCYYFYYGNNNSLCCNLKMYKHIHDGIVNRYDQHDEQKIFLGELKFKITDSTFLAIINYPWLAEK